jgi:hypothetical protein
VKPLVLLQVLVLKLRAPKGSFLALWELVKLPTPPNPNAAAPPFPSPCSFCGSSSAFVGTFLNYINRIVSLIASAN